MSDSKKTSSSVKDSKLSPKDHETAEHLVKAVESLGLDEFMEYIKSPWKLILPNLVAGVARGFGAVLGATIVVSILIWIISQLVGFPLVGKYFKTVQVEIQKFVEQTDYKEEFRDMRESLQNIERNTAPENFSNPPE